MYSALSNIEYQHQSYLSFTCRLILWICTAVYGIYFWQRNPQPVWSSPAIIGNTHPLGFTVEGNLITADGDLPYSKFNGNPALQPTTPLYLTTWDPNTGSVLSQVTRTEPVLPELGVITDARCELVVSRNWIHEYQKTQAIMNRNPYQNSTANWVVLDLRTGQRRMPYLVGFRSERPTVSPDGRYLILATSLGSEGYELIDTQDETYRRVRIPRQPNRHVSNTLERGKVSVDSKIFSPDSRQILSFEFNSEGRWIAFHSVPDLKVTGRCQVPELPGYSDICFDHWDENLLYLRGRYQGITRQFHFSEDLIALEWREHGLTLRPDKDIRQMTSEIGEGPGLSKAFGNRHWKAIHFVKSRFLIPAWVKFWNSMISRLSRKLAISWQCEWRSIQFLAPQRNTPLGVSINLANLVEHSIRVFIRRMGNGWSKEEIDCESGRRHPQLDGGGFRQFYSSFYWPRVLTSGCDFHSPPCFRLCRIPFSLATDSQAGIHNQITADTALSFAVRIGIEPQRSPRR